MAPNSKILQELRELKSSLSGLAFQNIYSVPDGYFEGLADQVLNRIKAIEAANVNEELGYLSPMLGNMSKQLPYTVPVGYFEGLEEKLMQNVRNSSDYQTATEELETISPLLSGLKKQIPYSVPQEYFENLAINTKTQANKTETKVVSLGSRKWFRYAAAAIVTGIIVMAGFLYFSNNSDNTSGGKVMAKFTRDVKKMDETQKDNLIDFIDAGMNGNETAEVNTELKSKEVQQLLQDIPDEELKDFQEQTEDIEDVLMTN